jgi:CheY-like chemotaxis protein
MMGGSIGVESREGQGSTFWFTIVLEQAAAQPPALPSSAGARAIPAKARSLASTSNVRILVAEDNATNRLVAMAQLRKLGYQATAVNNGAEAVEAVQQTCYDLVLMDCQMPVMDGFEANRRIHALQPDLPVIAVTADAMPDDHDRCLREGMSDYLAKPVNIHRLAEVLAKWLPAPVTA